MAQPVCVFFNFKPVPRMNDLSHITKEGSAQMVDVSNKPIQAREAIAEGCISLQPETLRLLQAGQMKKGEVLGVARIAGLQAAKLTSQLIPLCHQIALSKVSVDFTIEPSGVRITALAKTAAQTGVEMEALTAVSVAALTIYDMCKAVDKTMQIGEIKLLQKTKV